MPVRIVHFFAIVLTALALVPAGAHLLALPNKIGLEQDDYFVVQNIYRGWALLGIVLVGAVVALLILAVLLRDQRAPCLWASAAFLCVAATLAIFFTWTYPANVATDNWTAVPGNWRQLRAEWEYSHAANAVLILAGLCAVTLSLISTRQSGATAKSGPERTIL